MFYNCETRLSTITSTMLQTCMQALLVPKSKLQQYIEPDNLLLAWRVLELNFWSCALQEIVKEATTYGGWSIEDSIKDVVGGSLLEHATATEMAQVQAFGLIGLCVNGDKSEKLLSLYSSLSQTCSGQTTWHCRWIGGCLAYLGLTGRPFAEIKQETATILTVKNTDLVGSSMKSREDFCNYKQYITMPAQKIGW